MPNSANLDFDIEYLIVTRTMCIKWAEAVADANRAIELDPLMAKAYLRKGWVIIIFFTFYVNAFILASHSSYAA